MTNFIQKFKNTFFSKQFITFVIIGIINTFNGVIFSYIYSNFLNENIAFILGYISGLFISYLLNSFITFKERLNFSKFINMINLKNDMFITIYIVGMMNDSPKIGYILVKDNINKKDKILLV